MTTQAIIFMIIGASILWGGLATTLVINFKNGK